MAYCTTTSKHTIRIKNNTGDVSYSWSVTSPATIVSGQGTNSVRVETTGDTDITFTLTCDVQDDNSSDSLSQNFTHKRT